MDFILHKVVQKQSEIRHGFRVFGWAHKEMSPCRKIVCQIGRAAVNERFWGSNEIHPIARMRGTNSSCAALRTAANFPMVASFWMDVDASTGKQTRGSMTFPRGGGNSFAE